MKGSLFVVRGDVLHAGAGYAKPHMRSHWYIDFPGYIICIPSIYFKSYLIRYIFIHQ